MLYLPIHFNFTSYILVTEFIDSKNNCFVEENINRKKKKYIFTNV